MPPKRPMTIEEENALLKKQIAQLQAERAKTKASNSQNLIPRPKGQAGRGKGYNLQKSMRLQNNKARAHRQSQRLVRYYSNRFLKTGKTIRQQDPATLEKVIVLVKKEFKYFQRFKGGWPIRDFVKQYLANNTDKFKRAVRQEREAEAEDPDDWDEEGETLSEEDEESGVNDNEGAESDEGDALMPFDADEDIGSEHLDEPEPEEYKSLDEDGVEMLNEEGSVPSTPVKGKKALKNVHDSGVKENIPPTASSGEKNPKPSAKKTVSSHTKPPSRPPKSSKLISPSPQKRKRPDTPQEDPARPIKKKKLGKDSDPPSLAPTTRVDIPVICPGNYCKDVVPTDLPPSVLALFAQKRDSVHKDGPTAPGCAQLTKQICQAIKTEIVHSRHLTEAKEAGWPISIDFDDLPPRISALFPSLSILLSDSTVLARSPVWNKFLARIGFKVFAFSRSSNRFDIGNLGCGYFGPKGQNIIESTLQALSKNDDQDKLSNDLYATLSQLLDTPKPWDQYDETSNLISPRKFSKFILVPHIAAWLIAEDLEISMNDAVEVLINSNEYGRLFNGDLPEKVDIVVAANPESSHPPRHRKPAVNLKPTAREKKSAKKIVQKPKHSKSPKKSTQKKAEVKIPAPHGYGTRGAKTTT
ncbi:hypothetical protein B0H11DRAFT_2332341 [Mycena galericulata]|nr:hypothetical protein B0H11DRAFT_2332341 [Mycena galericulata]